MPEEKKSFLTKLNEFGKGYGTLLVVVGGLVGFGIDWNSRLWPDKETRDAGVELVKEGPTAEQKQRAIILDSVNKTNAIKSRKFRDSLLVEFGKDINEIKTTQKHQDSINNLNADQIFQIKEELKND